MLSSDIRSQIDAIWNAFWSGGISNPMEVLEQITYLLFIRRLDDAHTLEESKALLLKQPMTQRIFPEGTLAIRCALEATEQARVQLAYGRFADMAEKT